MEVANNTAVSYGDIPEALSGSTILVTGGAGFLASALLCRLLLDPVLCDSHKQVIALIRGGTVESAVFRLPAILQPFTRRGQDTTDSKSEEAKLVVLNGDSGLIGFDLHGDMAKIVQRADIVIHAAGDFRFTLPLPDAIANIVRMPNFSNRHALILLLLLSRLTLLIRAAGSLSPVPEQEPTSSCPRVTFLGS
jgi:hypothetical protein